MALMKNVTKSALSTFIQDRRFTSASGDILHSLCNYKVSIRIRHIRKGLQPLWAQSLFLDKNPSWNVK